MKKKISYRVRNWKQYNQSLINRGNLTLWVSEDVIEGWYVTQKDGEGRSSNHGRDPQQNDLTWNATVRCHSCPLAPNYNRYPAGIAPLIFATKPRLAYNHLKL